MSAVIAVEIVALFFGLRGWLSGRSELARQSMRWQYNRFRFYPYAIRMLLLQPLVAVPVALVGLTASLPHASAGPAFIATCLTGMVALAIANLRPPRLLPRWLADEVARGVLPVPSRGLYDWTMFTFFELAGASGIALVVLGGNK